jgi:hypothetical protein
MSLLHECELSQTPSAEVPTLKQPNTSSIRGQQDKGPKGDYCGRRTALSSMTINVFEKEQERKLLTYTKNFHPPTVSCVYQQS